jgi:hypothetical protein
VIESMIGINSMVDRVWTASTDKKP